MRFGHPSILAATLTPDKPPAGLRHSREAKAPLGPSGAPASYLPIWWRLPLRSEDSTALFAFLRPLAMRSACWRVAPMICPISSNVIRCPRNVNTPCGRISRSVSCLPGQSRSMHVPTLARSAALGIASGASNAARPRHAARPGLCCTPGAVPPAAHAECAAPAGPAAAGTSGRTPRASAIPALPVPAANRPPAPPSPAGQAPAPAPASPEGWRSAARGTRSCVRV